MSNRTICTLDDLRAFAKTVLDSLQSQEGASVIALHGDLGAGKTSFTQYLADALGVNEVVTSPTFVVQKEYQLDYSKFDQLVHIDAYRLEDESELQVLGFDSLLKKNRTLICIEWAERVKKLLPVDTQHITFTLLPSEERQVKWE